MKIRSRALALAFVALAPNSVRAQGDSPSEKSRVWYDLKAGVAFESAGGSVAGNNTDGALNGAVSRGLTKRFAIQISADYLTAILASSNGCAFNPANGGCIVGVTHKNFSTIGAAASVVITSGEVNAPKSDVSLGVGYYSVGGDATSSGVGFRAAVDRTLSSGKREALTIHGGLLILPMDTGAPMSIITVGLGLRVW